MANPVINSATKDRAARTGGTSANAIYDMVARALATRAVKGDLAVDLGCGRGALWPSIRPHFSRYLGADALRYDGFPAGAQFIEADLNAQKFPIESQIADAVFAVETIEHLENPRALLREMARIAKPRAWLIVTTPNQLSFLSLGTLIAKRRHSAFQEIHYPAHITALLESDLRHLAAELRLTDIAIEYSRHGRIVLTPLHYPKFLSRLFPRACSDNILLIARAP
jgi:2-polyprenyl-3-methyl-5-hydroxy-6-metoxy-1,4-benzoquinol methylase